VTLRDRHITQEFARRLRAQRPDAKIWAFGSRARGDAQPSSDIDLCVVMSGLNRNDRQIIQHIAWEVGFENELVISTVKFAQEEFGCGALSVSPLVRTVLREGLPV
jgi:predicted nucleotidyltransferase